MAKRTIYELTTSDEDADWIKLVHRGKYQRQELEAHKEIAEDHQSRGKADAESATSSNQD